LPEALVKRYRQRSSYVLSDSQVFEQTSTLVPRRGESEISFAVHDFAEQLGPGWHERETDGCEGFRWMSRKASLFLFPKGHEQALEIRGAVSDIQNVRRRFLKLRIYQEKKLLFTKRWLEPESFRLSIPLHALSRPMCRFDLELNRSFCPARLGIGDDTRELGIIVSQVGLV
jgi:hypothetical protein